jgi:hypothetical protein
MIMNWSDFKIIVDKYDLNLIYFEDLNKYSLSAFIGNKEIKSIIFKDNLSDITIFESSYKSKSNKPFAQKISPFFDKKIGNSSLFRRTHGYKELLPAQNNNIDGLVFINCVIPYNKAKINKMEVLFCPEGVKCDFEVYDTPTGTLSGIPNFMLNQFAFDLNIRENYHVDESHYDADLIKDMKIEIHFKNSSLISKIVGVNFHFHELK